MVDAREVRDVLEERPDLEPILEEILELDGPWTFDDLDADSGRFGELVSRGIVEESGDGYRLTDRQAVVRGVDGEVPTDDGDGSGVHLDITSRLSLPGPTVVGLLVGALGLLVALRLLSFQDVFRSSQVVLSGNDPYFYRFLVGDLLGSPETTLSALPDRIAKGEPLFVVLVWKLSALLGGSPRTVGVLLAVYPVVSAVLSGLCVYLLTLTVSRDQRVALTAVMLFALIPGHAFRTSLGFGDHHAFDNVFLTLTILSATVVSVIGNRGRGSGLRYSLGVVGLTVGLSGQVLAWEGSPALVAPVGLCVAACVLVAVRQGRSPLRSSSGLTVGILAAGAITLTVHQTLGWQSTLVAAHPIGVAVAGLGTAALGEAIHRTDGSVWQFLGLGGVVTAVGAGVVVTQFPALGARAASRVTGQLFKSGQVAETGGLFGQSFGWLLLFGFVFVLAVPYLALLTRTAVEEVVWTTPVVYAWWFLLLSAVQIRFVTSLAPLVATFGAVGVVHLAERIDVAESRPAPASSTVESVSTLPTPDRQTVRSVVLLFLLVGSLSFVQIPVKTEQVTHTTEQYETAEWMTTYSEERGWEYPQNYVFSGWGDNRFYNYFVNGQSRSYRFAQQEFDGFLSDTGDGDLFFRIRDRIGFIVLTPASVGPPEMLGTRLYAENGSRTDSTDGLGQFRMVYVSESTDIKVFTIVPGATVVGESDPNSTVTVVREHDVGGYSFVYERQVTANSSGGYQLKVPYAGRYRVENESIVVSEDALYNGSTVAVG